MTDDVTVPVPGDSPAPPAAPEAQAVTPGENGTEQPQATPPADEPVLTGPSTVLVASEPDPPAPAHEPPNPSLARAEEEEVEEAAEPAPAESAPAENRKRWYVVKVQSGREDTIKEAIERRVRKEGLEEYFGQIVIPVEKVTEVKTDKHGKRVTRSKERKLYPGYLMVEVEYNDRILYLFRETSGVGDFVGAHPGNLQREPTPMSEREVQRMIRPGAHEPEGKEKPDRPNPPPKWLDVGDRVRVVDGTFNGMEGIVKEILDAVGKVKVEVSIFGRPVAVELEYFQVEEV